MQHKQHCVSLRGTWCKWGNLCLVRWTCTNTIGRPRVQISSAKRWKPVGFGVGDLMPKTTTGRLLQACKQKQALKEKPVSCKSSAPTTRRTQTIPLALLQLQSTCGLPGGPDGLQRRLSDRRDEQGIQERAVDTRFRESSKHLRRSRKQTSWSNTVQVVWDHWKPKNPYKKPVGSVAVWKNWT